MATSRRIAFAAAAAAALIGLLGFIGWVTDTRVLTRLRDDFIPIAPNTAIAFLLLAGALFIRANPSSSAKLRAAARAVAGAVFALCALRFMDAVFGLPLDTDTWILRVPGRDLAGFPIGVMSPITAANFLLASSVLIFRPERRARKYDRVFASLGMAVFSVGLAISLGYVYGAPFLYRGSIIPVAATTAGGFLAMGTGIVAWVGPKAGPMELFAGSSVRARLMRTFIPLIAVFVLIEAWVVLYIAAEMHENPAVVAAIAAVASALFFGTIVAGVARKMATVIEAAEGERRASLLREKAAQSEAESARRESEFKSKFLASMSHELRTPLNAIIGFSELLEQEVFGPLNERQQDYVQNVLTSGRHLLNLVNDILDLSKIQAGRMTLSREWVELVPIAEAVVHVVGGLAQKRDLSLSVTVPEDLPQIYADPVRIKQVLYNLLSNAIKFTPEGGKVRLVAERTGETVTVVVEDTGIGIKAEDIPRLFQEFEQIEPSSGEKPEGTGLGLALTKRMVEMHAGSIEITSEVGRGTRVKFDLPARATAAQTIPADLPREDLVVIVEDDPRAAELIAGHLLGVGLGVAFARNAEEGRRVIDQLRPRAITLDINMEGVDGWALLADLKSAPQTADIPVVVISVDDEPQRAELLGAAEFLGKPLEKEALYRVLHAHGVPLRSVHGVNVVLVGPDGAELDRVGENLRRAGCVVVRAGEQDPRGVEEAARRADVLVTRALEDVARADVGAIPVVAIVAGDSENPERIVRAVFGATAEKRGKEAVG